MGTYYDAACLAFGASEFTVEDFRTRLRTDRAAKLLSELKTRGLVERTNPGHYRLLAPAERPDLRRGEWARVRNAILSSPLKKAWSGPSAVEAWTHGRYKLSTGPFAREFHVAVPTETVNDWRNYLAHKGIPTEPRRSIGPKVILEPRAALNAEMVDNEPVVPRNEVVKLIRRKPAVYAGAEALLADYAPSPHRRRRTRARHR